MYRIYYISLPSYSCVRQVHTLQSSLIINTTGMTNLMIITIWDIVFGFVWKFRNCFVTLPHSFSERKSDVQICTKCEVSGDEVLCHVLYGLWRHVIEQASEDIRHHIRKLARTPATTIDRFFVTSLRSFTQIAGQYVEQPTITSFPIHHSHPTIRCHLVWLVKIKTNSPYNRPLRPSGGAEAQL